jgi:hypothetical protein
MEITLSKEEIESIIKDKYEGVSEVKFNSKNIKATLTVDISKFKSINTKDILELERKKRINTEPVEQVPEKTLEERKTEAIQRGLMVPGGQERAIRRIG